MAETTEITSWVPVAPLVTIEEMFKTAGITRGRFVKQCSVLPSALRLGSKAQLKRNAFDYYDHNDCYFYEKGGKKEYIRGTRMIVKFGKFSCDDFYFLKEERGCFFKYEMNFSGRQAYIVISYADYQKLVHEDRVYLSSLPLV